VINYIDMYFVYFTIPLMQINREHTVRFFFKINIWVKMLILLNVKRTSPQLYTRNLDSYKR